MAPSPLSPAEKSPSWLGTLPWHWPGDSRWTHRFRSIRPPWRSTWAVRREGGCPSLLRSQRSRPRGGAPRRYKWVQGSGVTPRGGDAPAEPFRRLSGTRPLSGDSATQSEGQPATSLLWGPLPDSRLRREAGAPWPDPARACGGQDVRARSAPAAVPGAAVERKTGGALSHGPAAARWRGWVGRWGRCRALFPSHLGELRASG